MTGQGLALDFEGNLKSGIREIGIVSFMNFKISYAKEFIVNESIDLNNILENIPKDGFIISHNVMIEKNLIMKTFPYPTFQKGGSLQWGPWLDTVKIYQKLYPNLPSYDLKNLVAQFLNEVGLNKLTSKYCNLEKRKQHHALFDAICSFMLTERLVNLIDLGTFLEE